MGQIERLTEDIQLPLPDAEETWSYAFQRQFNGELEALLGEQTHVTVNLVLDLTGNTDFRYFGVPDSTGTYADGTWRIGIVGTQLVIQKLDSGTWVSYAQRG